MANVLVSKLFLRQCRREKTIIFRQKSILFQAFLFFLMFVAFFPLTLPFDLKILQLICPGVVWLALSLAIFLAAERFYQTDIQCAYLEQWLVQKIPLIHYVLSKWLVHGLVNLAGILLCVPLIALFYQLNTYQMLALVFSIICGLPGLLAMCGLVSAFGAYGPNRSLLMLLILFPLMIPILMLGGSCLSAALQGLAFSPYIALLAAMSLLMVFILSFASAAILKICLENA